MLAEKLAEFAYRQSWQLAVAAGIAWALLACAGRSRPHLRYLLWGAVLVKAITPPIWASSLSLFGGVPSLIGQTEFASAAVGESTLDVNSPLVAVGALTSPAVHSKRVADVGRAETAWNWAALGCFAWGAGGAALAAGLIWRYASLIRKVQRTAIDVPDGLRREVAELGERLGLTRPPRICLTTSGAGPAVAGAFAPKLILPAELWQTMLPADRRLVLTHELLHLVRRDPLAAALQTVVQLAWWFHPAVWFASREFSAARELCCDAALLSRGSAPSEYARCLLRVAIHQAQVSIAPIALVLPSTAGIKTRVAWITSPAARFRPRTPWSAWAIAALLLMVLLPSHRPRPLAGAEAAEPPRADRPQGGEKTPKNKDDAEPEVPSPELIAVTWQQREVTDTNIQRFEQPVWRPDGTLLEKADVNRLRNQLNISQACGWNKERTLRPLVLVFRWTPEIDAGLHAAAVVGDRKIPGQDCWGNLHHGLAKSGCCPYREKLAAWPEEVDLDVKVPLENPQVIKRLDQVPDQPVELARGVRWYINQRGVDRSNPEAPRRGLTAGVLEIDDPAIYSIDSLVSYAANIWLHGREEPLVWKNMTISNQRKDGGWSAIYASDPIDDVQKIERVEFTRQRFRVERIKNVKTRLDLLPAND